MFDLLDTKQKEGIWGGFLRPRNALSFFLQTGTGGASICNTEIKVRLQFHNFVWQSYIFHIKEAIRSVLYAERKIGSHFDLKSWVTGRTEIRPGIPNNWKIFESNYSESRVKFWFCHWLNFLGQNDTIFHSVYLTLNFITEILKNNLHEIILLEFRNLNVSQ